MVTTFNKVHDDDDDDDNDDADDTRRLYARVVIHALTCSCHVYMLVWAKLPDFNN